MAAAIEADTVADMEVAIAVDMEAATVTARVGLMQEATAADMMNVNMTMDKIFMVYRRRQQRSASRLAENPTAFPVT